ncbi:hypothetical protein KUTeg_016575 [Tegillarca granosa]|uniref:Uncharacterized protein n=1 Tax=Tegillarca granosa TaxID=220873 RepID=A0ABQ9ERJ3_TEGGR|nr:hypothetical protein KUTeg_016575 [Tegillarca granosa]
MYAESEYITITNDKTGFEKLSGSTPYIRKLPNKAFEINQGPKDSKIELNMDSFDVEDSEDGTCVDFLELRYYLIGQPGVAYCGEDFKESVISQTNLMGVTFETDLKGTRRGFKARITLRKDDDLCYSSKDKGKTYRGTVSYTRSFKKCLPWSKVTHCRHNLFDINDLDTQLESNYCRNPGDGTKPWCYVESYQCMRDYCDVCNLEKCYDVFDDCTELIASNKNFCQTDENAFHGCHKSCGFCEKDDNLRITKRKCQPPIDLLDAELKPEYLPKKQEYNIGEEVVYKCKTGKETTISRCLSDGTWSWTGFVCGACPTGWFPFKESCYKWFDDYKLKNESFEECKKNGAVVASAKNREESNFLRSIRGEDRKYWIGVKYVRGIGHFWEEDGSAVRWTNWWYGQTDGCAYVATNGRWKINKRKICVDRRQDCENVVSENSLACKDNPAFRRLECAVTCGFCTPGFGKVATCKNPRHTGDFVLETDRDEIEVGDVIVYGCKPEYAQTGGDLIHMCLPSGIFTGKLPICRPKQEVPMPINYQAMVDRRNVGSDKKAYVSFNVLHTVPKTGFLIKWQFYSGYSGAIVLQVWRPTNQTAK